MSKKDALAKKIVDNLKVAKEEFAQVIGRMVDAHAQERVDTFAKDLEEIQLKPDVLYLGLLKATRRELDDMIEQTHNETTRPKDAK